MRACADFGCSDANVVEKDLKDSRAHHLSLMWRAVRQANRPCMTVLLAPGVDATFLCSAKFEEQVFGQLL